MTRRVLVGAVLLAILGAASAGGAGAAGPRAASRAKVVRGVTNKSVKVGGLGYALAYSGADIGAQARFARANAAGGVNGRTIDYVGFRDDGGAAEIDRQAATQLLDKDRVFAMVPVAAPDLGAVEMLTSQKVPYFGWAISSNFCGNPYGFAFSGCLFPPGKKVTANTWGALVKIALGPQSANPPAVLLAENTAYGRYRLTALTAAAKSVGINVVSATSNLPVPPVADYGKLADDVLTANGGSAPYAVFIIGSYSNVTLIEHALRDRGFLGIITDEIQYSPDIVVSARGETVLVQTAPVESADSNPAMRQLVTDVRAIAASQPIDQSVIAGYWSADLFIAALKRAGKHLTIAGFLKSANHQFTYEVPKTVGPTRFPAAHDTPTPCGSLVRSDGVSFSVVVPYTCGKVVPVTP